MMMNCILKLCAVLFFAFCVCASQAEDSANINDDGSFNLPESIKTLAEKLEIFPIEIWARSGPLSGRHNNLLHWGDRYDWTFEQYALFYKLKEIALTASKDDIMTGVTKLETMTTREKALMLTVVFLFERFRRPRYETQREEAEHSPYLSEFQPISDFEGSRLFTFIERYENSKETAFSGTYEGPFRDTSNGYLEIVTLPERYFRDIERCKKRYKEITSFPYRTTVTGDTLDEYEKNQKKVEELCRLPEGRELKILCEYLSYYGKQRSIFMSGTAYPDGNSSRELKTLGDIATQLLKSRLSYPN